MKFTEHEKKVIEAIYIMYPDYRYLAFDEDFGYPHIYKKKPTKRKTAWSCAHEHEYELLDHIKKGTVTFASWEDEEPFDIHNAMKIIRNERFSEEDIEDLKAIRRLFPNFPYIARDDSSVRSRYLFLYEQKPEQRGGGWVVENAEVGSLFGFEGLQCITWEDEEPVYIPDILELEED